MGLCMHAVCVSGAGAGTLESVTQLITSGHKHEVSLLMFLLFYMEHHEVVKLLLNHPDIHVNVVDKVGFIGLFSLCFYFLLVRYFGT
jgi:hypothetical protein